MPNHKSAKKRVIINAKRALQNKSYNTALKTAVKKADLAVAQNADDQAEKVRLAIKKIDMAASKGILHKNTAARKKSALARKIAAS